MEGAWLPQPLRYRCDFGAYAELVEVRSMRRKRCTAHVEAGTVRAVSGIHTLAYSLAAALSVTLLFVGCGPRQGGDGVQTPAHGSISQVPQPRAEDADPPSRCLPVVAPECGCVYACTSGVLLPTNAWTFRHPQWGDRALEAQVEDWCVDGVCSESFSVALPCDGICSPRPAQPCAIVDGECRDRP